jgi:hypothetical protein
MLAIDSGEHLFHLRFNRRVTDRDSNKNVAQSIAPIGVNFGLRGHGTPAAVTTVCEPARKFQLLPSGNLLRIIKNV